MERKGERRYLRISELSVEKSPILDPAAKPRTFIARNFTTERYKVELKTFQLCSFVRWLKSRTRKGKDRDYENGSVENRRMFYGGRTEDGIVPRRLVPCAELYRRVGRPRPSHRSSGYRLLPVNESCLIGVGSPRLRPRNGIELYPIQHRAVTTR